MDTITTHSSSHLEARNDLEPDAGAELDFAFSDDNDSDGDDDAVARRPARGGRGNRLTLLATAAAALHVIDDNVVQPAWGGIDDHLASALVPLTALAGLVYFLSRRRPGTRATMILILGILGLMLGSEAIYDLSTSNLSGDDYTGLLSVVAGVTLLAIGVRDLWRSRCRTGSLWRTTWRRWLRTVASLLVIMMVAYPVIETYVVSHASVRDVPTARLNASYEDVEFTTTDGVELRGWFVPSENGATIIVFPGRTRAQDHARMLIRNGYGVLLFDKRGTGESDGEPNGYGWGGQRDIHAAVAYLGQRADVDPARIGGIGLSVGGELMLQAAAESDGLRAVVSEGAGVRSIREVRGDSFGIVDYLFAGPVVAMSTISNAVFTNSMPPKALQDLVPDIEVPVFYIYANPGGGGELLSQDYYELATGPKQVWAIDGSHIGGIDAEPEEYERRVVAFYDDALLG